MTSSLLSLEGWRLLLKFLIEFEKQIYFALLGFQKKARVQIQFQSRHVRDADLVPDPYYHVKNGKKFLKFNIINLNEKINDFLLVPTYRQSE